jgi:3-hexulose-6-phosphate synthase/6-phospho-3-hexuloisomerase
MTEQPRARLQVALDFIELDRALQVAEEAAAGGADILEAGTPLIKSAGLDAVRQLRARFPKLAISADMKVMDAGRLEVEAAAKAGAHIVHVLAADCRRPARDARPGGAGGAGSGAGRGHD